MRGISIGKAVYARLVDAVEVADLAVQHMDIAARTASEFLFVGDHHDGGALAIDVFQHVDHLACHQGIKVSRRFVGQQETRPASPGNAKGHPRYRRG